MFDTIRCGVDSVELDPDRLLRKGWVKNVSSVFKGVGFVVGDESPHDLFDESERYVLIRKNESPHFLSYSVLRGDLKVETSLPKILNGDNVGLLSSLEMERALDELSNRVSDFVGGDVLDVRRWDVRGRMDAVFSWRAMWDGENHVYDYLRAFSILQLPRHYSQSVDKDATLYWRNRSRVIRMYDKFEETKLEGARGLLRFEVQMNRAKGELGFKGGELKVGDVVNWETSSRVLERYLSGLGADLVVGDEVQLLRSLIREFGPARARRLYGSLKMSQLIRDDDMRRDFGMDRKLLWRDRREISRVGLSKTMTADEGGLLKPLQLPAVYDGQPGDLSE